MEPVSIITRAGKGAALLNSEIDTNFTNLKTGVATALNEAIAHADSLTQNSLGDGTASPPPSVPISFVSNRGGAIVYDSETGITQRGTAIASGDVHGIVPDIELQSLTISPVSYVILGLNAAGEAIIVGVGAGNNGLVGRVTLAGGITWTTGAIFPTTNLNTSTRRVRISSNVAGDHTIERLNTLTGQWVVWGSVTKATLDAKLTAPNTLTQRKPGWYALEMPIVYEFEKTDGTQKVVGAFTETAGANDLFNRVYPFNQDRILLVGDSIVADTKFTTHIKAKTKAAVVYNQGTAGKGWVWFQSLDRMNAMLRVDPDLAIIWLGTNDFGLADATVFGDLATFTDTTANPPGTTFVGAVNKVLNDLRKNRPGLPVMLATPAQRTGQNTPNADGKILKDYVDAMKTICAYYAVPVLDIYNMGMLTGNVTESVNALTTDGLHFTDYGYDLISGMIVKLAQSLKF